MKKYETTISINATPQRVYQILTDLNTYEAWNPFIIKSEGKVAVGNRIKNTMRLKGRKPQTFKPKVLKAESGRHFRWKGSLPIPGLFTGEHYFILEKAGEGKTKLIHGEVFGGLLHNLIMNKIGEATLQGYRAMNEALKQRAENQQA